MLVHLRGHLSWYDPQKRSQFEFRLNEPLALADLLERIGIPTAEIAVAAVNGQAVDIATARLSDADRLDLLPPVGGG